MHLIGPLISGIAAAANGTVDLLRRGSSVHVTYYTSFEGDGATTPTSSIDLDATGGGVFYVNEITEVVVRDETGTEVRRFVSADAASSVEVISQSFTGTDYATAQTGSSKPTHLDSVLDLWRTNAGASDFKVRIAGVDTTLQQAFATVGAAFINVKASPYNAVGDGTSNDTSAIQAALDAASSAGGGTVFFPAGTYKTTSALTVADKVSLDGAGPAVSIIAMASQPLDILTMSAGNTTFSSIRNLKIGHSQASIGSAVNCVAGRKLRIDNCWIGNPFNNQSRGIKYDGGGTFIFVTNTTFDVDTGGGFAVLANTATVNAVVHIWGCKVQFNGAYTGSTVFSLSSGTVLGTEIDGSGMTSGTSAYIVSFDPSSSRMKAFCFNSVSNPTGGTLSVAPTGLGDKCAEYGNALGTLIVSPDAVATPAKSTYFGASTLGRDRGRYYTQDDTAAVAVLPAKYGLCEVERLTTGAQTCTLTNAAGGSHVGSVLEDFVLVYNNLAQASPTGTITLAGNVKGINTFTVNANSYSLFFFKAIHVAAVTRWALVNKLENQV